MENKLRELENILNKLKTMPRRCGESMEIITRQIGPSAAPGNNHVDAAKEDAVHMDTVRQLRDDISRMESVLREYERKVETLSAMNCALRSNEKELRNAVLRAKGAIRVLCRMRPSSSSQNIRYDDTSIEIGDKKFALNHVFDQRSTQEELFAEIRPEIQSILDGYSICIFAYGQTGSGKTHTMEGPAHDRGLVFRSLREIDGLARKMLDDGFLVKYSAKYLEIYNENIRDLINNGAVVIVHDQNSIKLKNCSETSASNIHEVESVVEDACTKRRTGRTNCNSASSRSHSIFILRVLIERENERREGVLCLVDLAGSERLDESKSENERLRETKFINKSLSALGNVMTALKRKDRHIPFRDSKLTHLMQEYLSGTSRVSMIVNVNPENVNETICSLRFASKVSECASGAAVGRNITKIT